MKFFTKPIIRSFATVAVFVLAVTTSAHASFTASGRFLYVDRVFTFGGGFTGSEPSLPIRLATVQVINNSNGQVLATGSTDENGDVSIFVPGNGTANIVVRCFSRTNQFGGSAQRVTTGSNQEYSVSSSVFNNWNLGTNLAFGTVTAQKVTTGGRQGGPFNLLDQLVAGLEYVKAQGANNPTSSLRMIWPASGSFASGNNANLDTDDGFDDLVQLHELGHVIHNHYSDNDEIGAAHSFGQSNQDPRLSLGEGWASFFAGAVRQFQGINNPGFYMDCSGTGQTGGGTIQLRMRFEDGVPFQNTTGGEADEGAVFCALWELVDTPATSDGIPGDDDLIDGSLTFNGLTADEMHWDVFTGPVNIAANLTIRDFWNGFFAPTNHGHHPELEDFLDDWGMRFYNDPLEPNNTQGTATPHTLSDTWSPVRTIYFSNANPPAPGEGDSDYYALDLLAGSVIELETRYPNGNGDAETYCDPRMQLYRPNGTLAASDNDSGVGRNAKLSNQAINVTGTWTARVYTSHSYRRTGSYDFRARLISSPSCPNPASATNFGVGKAGASGIPVINSPAPQVPSQSFQITIANAPASSAGLLFLGFNPIDVPFDGGHLYLTPTFTLPITASPFGLFILPVPLNDLSACGATLHLQAIFPGDPGASGFYQTSQTNRLTLNFGS